MGTEPSEGSSFYYALSRTTAEKRRAVIDILRIAVTLAQSLHDVTDPEVAQKKIHWWHEEIDRLYGGEPRHPVLADALASVTTHDIEKSLFLSILEANNTEKFSNAMTRDAYYLRLQKDYGARISASRQILTGDTELPREIDSHWAIAFGIADGLSRFRYLYNKGYPVFPNDDYSIADLTPDELGSPENSDRRLALFNTKIDQGIEQFEIALSVDDPAMKKGTLGFYILASLKLRQMHLWKKQATDLYRFHVSLTPFTKALTTYKVRRRFIARA